MQGRTLLHYHFLEKIGEGGMGLVYKARDQSLGRLVAIKVLPGDRLDESSRSRFFREARTASALNHPNIITIHEIASCEGTEMIVMEYVEGHTLGQLLAGGPLPLADVFRYGGQIANALAKAHAAGVIHRDLKPGNVMITADRFVKVLDFGLAKMQRPSHGEHDGLEAPTLELTGARVVLGTAAYMSPEQAAAESLDARTDVFSFGIVLYEMIGGRRPFEGRTTLELLRQLMAPAPVSLESLRDKAPAALLEIVGRALAKERDERFESMDRLRDALREAQAQWERDTVQPRFASSDAVTIEMSAPSPVSPPETRQRRASRLRGRRRLRIGTAAALSVAAVMLVLAAFPALRTRLGGRGAATAESSTPYQHFTVGQSLMMRHDRRADVDKAIQAFTSAVQQDPTYAPGYAGLADAYYRKNILNPDPTWRRQALDAGRRAVELNADLAVAHLALGRAQLANVDLTAADQHLRRALELDPSMAGAHMSLAAVHAAANRPADAEREYLAAIGAAPRDWQPLAEMGQFLYKSARYQEAVDAWERCAAIVADSATIHRQLGAAYHMLDRPDEAAGAFQRALQIEPTAPVYNNLGTLRFFQGKYAEAVDAFRKAVQLRANSHAYWGNLGDAHRWNPTTKREAADAYATAIRIVSDTLETNPGDHELRTRRALYRVKNGDTAGALEDVAMTAKAKASPAMLFYQTIVYEVAGNRTAALESLERALAAGYSLREIQIDPELVNLRADARYQLLLSRRKL